jgi:iturin family lipopeptide synthetase A
MASVLSKIGIKPKTELIFQITNNEKFIITFWACIINKIIPVPLTVGGDHCQREKVFKIWKQLSSPCLIIEKNVFELLEETFPGQTVLNSKRVYLLEDLLDYNMDKTQSINLDEIKINPDDLAYVQYTSGTTGEPKGIRLSHKNLIANFEGIKKSAKFTKKDSFLSWMPLTHDMGMIGLHMFPFRTLVNQYLIPNHVFVRRPILWIEKVNQHRPTTLCAPNFGYSYFLKFFKPDKVEDWDLSNIRLIFNGAEPISIDICNQFVNALHPFGLKKSTMFTVYGMAEASLAAAFPPPCEEFTQVHINRVSLKIGKKVEEVKKGDDKAISFVVEGKPVAGCKIRIMNQKGDILEDGHLGYIDISGDNVTKGYHNNPKEDEYTQGRNGWFRTGDLGFFLDRKLVVTGRKEDLLNIKNKFYFNHDIEKEVESVTDKKPGRFVIIKTKDPITKKNKLFGFIVYRKFEIKTLTQRLLTINTHLMEKFSFNLDYLIPVKSIPKTTSGKIQRFKLVDQLKTGELNKVIEDLELQIEMINQNNYEQVEAPALV